MHMDFSKIWLDDNVTPEVEADIPPDSDGITNLLENGLDNTANNDRADDGWLNNGVPMPNCQQTTLQIQVSKAISLPTMGDMYLNVWFDSNRDGDWGDFVNCAAGGGREGSGPANQIASEWIVRNFIINSAGIPAGGSVDINVPTGLVSNAEEDKNHWIRFTLAEQAIPQQGPPNVPDGRSPREPYKFGETEDYRARGQGVDQEGTLVLEKRVLADDSPVPYAGHSHLPDSIAPRRR